MVFRPWSRQVAIFSLFYLLFFLVKLSISLFICLSLHAESSIQPRSQSDKLYAAFAVLADHYGYGVCVCVCVCVCVVDSFFLTS